MIHPAAPMCIAFVLLSTGCASITTGQNQSLSVEAISKGQTVAGASCRLENDKGTWFATTPGTVVVRRSYADISVRCDKNEHEPGITVAQSSTKAMAFGNILFGGIIGGAIDAGSGAAYDYPSIITVELGRRRMQASEPPVTGDKPAADDSVGAAGQAAGAGAD